MSEQAVNSPILVLDKNFQPIAIRPAKDVVGLLFTEAAKILDSTYNVYTVDQWIEYSKLIEDAGLPTLRTATFNFIVPEIIFLTDYVRKQAHSKKLRYNRSAVFKRDNNQCQYCARDFKKSELTVDHVLPKSRGGKSTWLNIATACKPCNWKKADKLPAEAGMKLIAPLRIPTWRDSVLNEESSKKESWSHFI